MASVDEALQVAQSLPRSFIPSPTVNQIGPAVDGYKRSPYLLHHILRLNTSPNDDIIVKYGPGSKQTVGVSYPYPPMRALFRAARDKAMTTGDEESIAHICHFVLWNAHGNYLENHPVAPWNYNIVIEQFSKEFKIHDLKRTILEMQKLQWEEEYFRP